MDEQWNENVLLQARAATCSTVHKKETEDSRKKTVIKVLSKPFQWQLSEKVVESAMVTAE